MPNIEYPGGKYPNTQNHITSWSNIFHSEGLVHPGTYSAQANDSSRQMLVSENKVVEHNDHHDFLYWWLSLRIRSRCVFLWYLWNALKVAAMETPENICTHTAAQKGAARWWHTLWVGDTKGVTQIGTRPCVTQIGTQRVGDWLQRWRPTHLVYSVAMYNSALMTHSQHYGIDYLTFWNGKKCQPMMLENFIALWESEYAACCPLMR